MKIGEAATPVRQSVQIRRIDLAAERADIGKPEVVCHYHQEVGPLHDDDDNEPGRARVSVRRHAARCGITRAFDGCQRQDPVVGGRCALVA